MTMIEVIDADLPIAQLHRKRRQLGELGIGEHIELDPIFGVVVVYEAIDGGLEVKMAGLQYTSERLGSTRFVVDLETLEGFRVSGAEVSSSSRPKMPWPGPTPPKPWLTRRSSGPKLQKPERATSKLSCAIG